MKSIANQTSVYYLRKFAKGYAHMHQCYQSLTSYVSLTYCRALAFHIAYKDHRPISIKYLVNFFTFIRNRTGIDIGIGRYRPLSIGIGDGFCYR